MLFNEVPVFEAFRQNDLGKPQRKGGVCGNPRLDVLIADCRGLAFHGIDENHPTTLLSHALQQRHLMEVRRQRIPPPEQNKLAIDRVRWIMT